MSITVLVQVHDEVRRLAIAGGAVAGGDFRLRELVAPLEQAGAKAPVFARVAQSAQAVVDSDERTASAALLDLATLVGAILYTQGETGASGELAALDTADLGVHETRTSARVVKPLLDALKSAGSGRLELVRDAVERGAFRDLRLVKPAVDALDDPYPEIAQLVADKVLPLYGRAIAPQLLSTLDLKGRGGHVHRLRLLHRLDPETTRELVRRAVDEGSKEVRVAAIECLGTTGGDLAILLEQAKAKARDVRAAALKALSAVATPAAEVVAALKRAIDGADLELLAGQSSQSKIPELEEHVLAQADRQLAATLAERDPKLQGPAVERLRLLLRALGGRTDAKAEAFLLKCFAAVPALTKIKSTPSGQDVSETLVYVLARGTPTMRQRLVAAHATFTGAMLAPTYEVARQILTPAEFYKQFSPLLLGLSPKRGKKGADHERAEALVHSLAPWADHWSPHHELGPADAESRSDLDPRWLDAAVDAGAIDLVCELARPGHAKASVLLAERLASAKPHEALAIMRAMVRVGHPAAGEAIVEAIKKDAKATYSYMWHQYAEMIPHLPRSELPTFEALLLTVPEKVVDALMASVIALRNKFE